MDTASLALLSNLWLHEPDESMLALAREGFALPAVASTAELAMAYTDLLLLNVYPYGTAYTDAWGELNTPEAQSIQAKFEAHGYRPKELLETGAPDHLGLSLGFLAYLLSLNSPEAHREAEGFACQLLHWAPTCCFAAEREPGVHAFYRALAQVTRETLFNLDHAEQTTLADSKHRENDKETQLSAMKVGSQHGSRLSHSAGESADDEFRLRDVVRTLLTPSRCGMFLSRGRLGRLANSLEMRLPFGTRFEVAEWLFASAGESEQIVPLLGALDKEAQAWAGAYQDWAAQWPHWRVEGARWLARIAYTRTLLQRMLQQAQSGVEISFTFPSDPNAGLAEG